VLGLYDTARRWSWYPFIEPFSALSEVAVASFSRAQTDPDRFARFVTRGILVMLTVSMPAIAFVGVETPSVIRVLLGNQWSAAVPFMRWLSVAAFAGSLARVTQWIYLSLGHTHRLLLWSLCVQGPVALGAALTGFVWGPLGVAAALAIGAVLVALPAVWYAVQGTPLGTADVLRAAARPALASLAGAAVLLAIQGALPATPGPQRLAIGLGVYATALAGAWLAMPGGVGATRELVTALREFR
jgi:PST family polysaccharide transporter